VIPVHNGEAMLAGALESALGQTLGNVEVIVVDDGSTDATAAVIAEYIARDDRVVPVSQANRGLSAARNAGVAVARGRMIAFLDADDVWLPTKLERQLAYLDAHRECDACFTYFEVVNDELRVTTPWSALEAKYAFDEVGPELLVERGNYVAGSGSSVMARAEAVREVGGFDERLRLAAEDLDLWYRLAVRRPLRPVPEVLVRVRRSPRQMQSDFGRVLRGRLQFLDNVVQNGDSRHGHIARRAATDVQSRLVRHELRRGRLVRGAAEAMALVKMRTTRRTS
jgi:glycosyltransferase involved in cell wall biosynthesis